MKFIHNCIEIYPDNNNTKLYFKTINFPQYTTSQFDVFLPSEKTSKNRRDEDQYFTINTESNPLNNLTGSVSVRESSNLNNLNNLNLKLREKCEFFEFKYNELQGTYNEALEIVKNHQTFYYQIFQIFNKK
jgi:hypothetical protein